jgi:hypothetical protein
VRPEPAGELLDPGHAFVAALGDEGGGAELDRELLAGLVAAHGDDALRAEPPGRQHGQQPDRAVTGHPDGPARAELNPEQAGLPSYT